MGTRTFLAACFSLFLPLLPGQASEDGAVLKSVIKADQAGENLLTSLGWRPWDKGFLRQGDHYLCDNGSDQEAKRGLSQTVQLDQTRPEPVVAVAWSKAHEVGGSRDSDYALYLDLIYTDGTPLYGQIAPFSVGTHDWEEQQVIVFPEKPIRFVAFHLLLRSHTGKAWFRDPELRRLAPPGGAMVFDGVPVGIEARAEAGFQVRDAARGSDFHRIEKSALGLQLSIEETEERGAVFLDATLADRTGRDRAVTLVYAFRVEAGEGLWLQDPRRSQRIEPLREYMNASRFSATGAAGRLSRYPLGAVACKEGDAGAALGIDMACPAFFRIGYHAGTEELFIAFDLGLTPEKPSARVRFCRFGFDNTWGFRSALARYYEIFPEDFLCRIRKQGIWMPFAAISAVKGWEDFGFRFKEGTNETGWDDEHDVITFRYTEPMTWWMKMPEGMARTPDAALAEARKLAAGGDRKAQAFLASGYHDDRGCFSARLRDTPWCNGAVWSMNSMPGIRGKVTDFKNKWSTGIRERLYGPGREADLDGEYIDSSEGYVTDELDFRRDHFAAAEQPLTFSQASRKPAIFRGLIAFEYVRAIARDIHGMDRLMMANATPIRLCWLAPLLDVMGTETNWNPGGRWQPMSDAELLYRRALCKGKPYCFLMNTDFDRFSHALVEKYMKRCLAYGAFPGFFSHNASEGHYFTRPALYDRDRALFRRYVPLCRKVAEAGWEPIPLVRSSDEKVYVERFGERYLTVFNDSPEKRTVTLTLEGLAPRPGRDLLTGRNVNWRNSRTTLTLEGEDVAVVELL